MNRLLDRTCLFAMAAILLMLAAISVAPAAPAPGDCAIRCQEVTAGVPCVAGAPQASAFVFSEATCIPCGNVGNVGNCRYNNPNLGLCLGTHIDIDLYVTIGDFAKCDCNDGGGTNYDYAEAWNYAILSSPAPSQVKLKICSVNDPIPGGGG